MMTNDLLRFAEMGTRVSVIDLKIKSLKMDVRETTEPSKLEDIVDELIQLVEQKTELIIGISQFTPEKFQRKLWKGNVYE